MSIYNSIEELIGGTPLVRLSNIEKAHGLCCKLYAKLEYFNPTGSAKDRAASRMLLDAEKTGRIAPGATIIEPTSGNTGIALAALCCARGYRMILVMPETMSKERQLLAKAYGAELVLTPGPLGMGGSSTKALELAAEIPNSFIPSQFDNPANPQAHYETMSRRLSQASERGARCRAPGNI